MMNLNTLDDNAKDYLEKILAILDIDASVEKLEVDDSTCCYRIDCKSDDARMLIGRNGQTLEALQFVLRQMVKSNSLGREHFIVDVLDYRTRRRRTLEESAKQGAVAVLNGDNEHYPLLAMSAYDRRLVHNYLQEAFPELASESEGEGPDRHIVISYKGLPDGERGTSPEDEEYGSEIGDEDDLDEIDADTQPKP
ncbi:MAG: spoIIIJ-associated protein [Cyanobacteriota bacterium erpe_2018_sw_21hr_WHONDRS-SW48-000092_B_bin.40]|jgi:spoIIIJ-associated protein|nr:spoIIIJ-associated protein [Cyanobacteriota bacterium erpe_2018_sw_21hr_WHONDRS-SW48-000092_B_bin.40]